MSEMIKNISACMMRKEFFVSIKMKDVVYSLKNSHSKKSIKYKLLLINVNFFMHLKQKK